MNRVDYDLNIKKSDTRGMELVKHQFEFFLKEDFIEGFLSPEYERNFSVNGTRVNTAIQMLRK